MPWGSQPSSFPRSLAEVVKSTAEQRAVIGLVRQQDDEKANQSDNLLDVSVSHFE